jgi:aminoglycoside 2''-phosphotransferase
MENLSAGIAGYLALIRSRLPTLEIRSATANMDGLINVVIIVNDAWVFRFPREAEGRAAQAREKRLLDFVRPRLDLPVPEFEAFGEEFVRYRLIPGEALSRSALLRLDEAARERIAGQLGGFLRKLHRVPPEALAAWDTPPAGSVRTREDWLRFYARLEEKLFPLLLAHHKRWIREHFEPVLSGSLDLACAPALVHGDLGAYHILFDPREGRLTGVIDFGVAGLGDPADDFANIIYYLGESFLQKMSGACPEIVHAIDRARFWAGTLELQWALNGVQTGDHSWLTNHLGSARDVLPYGTPWLSH